MTLKSCYLRHYPDQQAGDYHAQENHCCCDSSWIARGIDPSTTGEPGQHYRRSRNQRDHYQCSNARYSRGGGILIPVSRLNLITLLQGTNDESSYVWYAVTAFGVLSIVVACLTLENYDKYMTDEVARKLHGGKLDRSSETSEFAD